MEEGKGSWHEIIEGTVQKGHLGQREESWIPKAEEEITSQFPKSRCILQTQEIHSQEVFKVEVSKETHGKKGTAGAGRESREPPMGSDLCPSLTAPCPLPLPLPLWMETEPVWG